MHPEMDPADEMPEEDDDLAHRLRGLDWPKPPPGLRERSLRELQQQLEQDEAARAASRTRGDD